MKKENYFSKTSLMERVDKKFISMKMKEINMKKKGKKNVR
jgi:hypothetical protein